MAFGLVALVAWFFAMVLAVGSIVLWVWMLVECITREPQAGNDRVVWLLVILLGGCIGALVYWVVRRPQRIEATGR